VKWLVKVSLLSQSFEGYYQKARYVYVKDPLEPEGAPVTAMRVRALIARPADGAEVARGPVEVAGTAWSGFGAITRVEVSVDGGRSWGDAALGDGPSPHSARPWRYRWRAHTPGEHTLIARASDSAGHIQPLDPVNNVHGYGNNIAHRVRARVR
jgi:hypothetical protein